jgi:hypothetical protein
MKYRKLDENGDYTFGQGIADFLVDVPEAPAQAVLTRLFLFQGDWFLDQREGMTWKTKVLGNRTASTRDPAIRRHVLRTRGVRSIQEYNSQLDRNTRAFSVQMTIDTVYGPAVVSGVNY